jgi:hypothetical protein
MKYKRTVLKYNVNGRVMVDPAIFRRINPNYPLSYIRHKEEEIDDDSDDSDSDCGCDSDSDDGDDTPATRVVVYKDKKGKVHLVEVPAGEDSPDLSTEQLGDTESGDSTKNEFTEEELLIASPVVLGFSFAEKNWLVSILLSG